jgi:RNA recognition motif-containing protein
MSTFEKRAREDKKAQKARLKEQRREEKRSQAPAPVEIISAAEVIGNVRSIEEVLRELHGDNTGQRSAPPIPSKLFVGSLSDRTTSASLRAHFEADFAITEAVVITDRNTGASRNFGFVTATDRKDAATIIDRYHHSELDGHRIVVNVATENR